MASEMELNDLKASWLNDPSRDLEETEGFEEHADELRAFAEAHRVQQEKEYQNQIIAKAIALGCPGNIGLAAYIDTLERRITRLEQRLPA
ncbi:hypothetical protein [Ensifer sp. LCM 4579]|uniref:hypothetical protein n=1 Tax=Ensifer sp. LCM 4579 TaxID=1848292 RepID=UPI0008D9DC67|nr:hypothetical protein [Ensifer sp. LCM 4579]OHV80311.1 hypothetical protein LCM4579_22225 [Ensifer sp. LCM 4579]